MSVNNFAAELKTALSEKYNLDAEIDLDFQVDNISAEACFKTEVADRLSDYLRLSPASIAKPLVDNFKSKYPGVSADNLGNIYLRSEFADVMNVKLSESTVLIYLQPPSDPSFFDLSYVKIISQVLLQIKFLQYKQAQFRIIVPSAEKLLTFDPQSQSFAELGLKLISLLKEACHDPKLADLDLYIDYVHKYSAAKEMNIWITPALLSLPAVADKLRSIKLAEKYLKAVNVYSQNLEPDWNQDICREYQEALLEHQAAACVYITEVKHFNDLDWQGIATDNWLSLSHALNTFISRSKKAEKSAADSQFHFLISNLTSIIHRAAYNGASAAAIRSTRKIAEEGHKLLNKGINLDLAGLNSSYSLLTDLSNIIR